MVGPVTQMPALVGLHRTQTTRRRCRSCGASEAVPWPRRCAPLALGCAIAVVGMLWAPSAGAFCTNGLPSIQAAFSPTGGSFGGPENVQVNPDAVVEGFHINQ